MVLTLQACNNHYSGHWKGWALEMSTFLGPNGTRFARSHFRAQKSLGFQGSPLPMPLVMVVARVKTIMYREHYNFRQNEIL
jgi:hypothetical protein